jgi:hypothetical protein
MISFPIALAIMNRHLCQHEHVYMIIVQSEAPKCFVSDEINFIILSYVFTSSSLWILDHFT